MKNHLIISIFVLIIGLLPYLTFGQCDSLRNWSDINLTKHLKYGPKKWKKSYYDYFRSDSGENLITADSVLISYLRHPENQINYGILCSYFLATSYAENELNRLIETLNKNLGEVDSMNFKKSQAAWLDFYQREREFINHAFVSYANYSKYGHGREIMMDNAARIYNFIKNRILDLKYYIKVSDYQEETNDD